MSYRRFLLQAAVLLLATSMSLVSIAAGSAKQQFTIAVIPDTQNYLDYTHQKAEGFPFDANKMFIQQMEYIAANLRSAGGDIVFVSSLGDVWQHQSLLMDEEHKARGFSMVANPRIDPYILPTEKTRSVEMPKAHQGFSLIAGKVPFSVVPGNHDYDSVWTDSKFPPAKKYSSDDRTTAGIVHPGGLDNFRSVFGAKSEFFRDQPWYVEFHDGGADSAQIFEAGGYRFLHIGLQFDPPNDTLNWAAEVLNKYSGLPTIISTHDYMNTQGERKPNATVDAHRVDSEHNNPEMVWQKFISQHDQIFMVLCGHHRAQSTRVDDNVEGNPVWQMLSDYQARNQVLKDINYESGKSSVGIGDGWMRFLTFDMSGEEPQVHVRTYSTHYHVDSAQSKDYDSWYRKKEQPHMSPEEFSAADHFSLSLDGFRARFQRAIPAVKE